MCSGTSPSPIHMDVDLGTSGSLALAPAPCRNAQQFYSVCWKIEEEPGVLATSVKQTKLSVVLDKSIDNRNRELPPMILLQG